MFIFFSRVKQKSRKSKAPKARNDPVGHLPEVEPNLYFDGFHFLLVGKYSRYKNRI
jgi:hypothetical protein